LLGKDKEGLRHSPAEVPPLKSNPEILSPAGDFEKLQVAIAYGADAVYIGGKQFSLRANTKNFDMIELESAIKYAHSHNVRVYVAVNIFAHNSDLDGLHEYLRNLKNIGADAVIVADLGVFDVARQIPGLEIHISTQANVTNYQSAALYKSLGAKRVILARELSCAEIRKVNDRVSDETFQTEVFAHGAMCVSYSGRCLLSSYMTGRDSNHGDCAQPCRWSYNLMEEQRPGEYLPVYETQRGTYIMNSKDLCLVEYIPELVASGVSSLKIEGRMKSAYYVAVATSIYRQALDDYYADPLLYESKKAYYVNELQKTSHRPMFTGFFADEKGHSQNPSQALIAGWAALRSAQPASQGCAYETNTYSSTCEFLGIVTDYNKETGCAIIEQRNKFSVGDKVEFMKAGFTQTITDMYNAKGQPVDAAPHAQEQICIKVSQPVVKFDIMRR